MQDQYVPGVCNIGKNEIKRRKQAGWAGLIVAIVLYILLLYIGTPRILRLVIFFPATMAAIGFLQARMHFCAYFGMHGMFNFSQEVGRTDTVEQAEFRAMDRRKAQQIIAYSAIVGIIVALAAYLLP